MINAIKGYFCNFYIIYGLWGAIAAAAVLNKIMLFYFFMSPITNIAAVFVVSCILTYLLFASFKNKWIPAGVFAALSVLMFCDVMYASFFNRYLSINMIAAAAFLGDIAESILEVFRAPFLLLFADVILIFACLIMRRKTEREEKKKFVFGAAALLIIAILIVNAGNSSLIKSISNQEIITYHIKDVAYKVFAITEDGDMPAFVDTYTDEKDGPLFGVAGGRNLIVIQIESLQNFVIGLKYNGQEVTPNLNRLIAENTAYFDNYYQQIGTGNTSDAEFASNNSIYGSIMSYTYKIYGSRNYFRGLPVMLKERGYETVVFHAYENKDFWSRRTTYPNMGFDKFYGGLNNREGDGVYEMKEWMGWGLTDTYFYKQTLDFMDELKQPFYSLVITLSNHHPYIMLDHYKFIELLPEDEDTIVGNYLQSAAYTDYTLGQFLDGLKRKGLYDNSIIAIYGDHFGLPNSVEIDASMKRLLGSAYDYDTLMNIPLLISIPGAEADVRQTVSTAGGQMDFFPTIAYLMGFEKLDTLYLGHNLFAVKEGLVAVQTYMAKGSFFKNGIAFEMSKDGVFEHGRAWDLKTGKAVAPGDCYDDYVRAMDIINTSEYILRSDAIRRIYVDGADTDEAFNVNVSRMYPESIAIAGAPGSELGSTIKNIEYSHAYDQRWIRVELKWTDEKEPVAVDGGGKIVMTHEELIEWMESHADTLIVANIERSGDYLLKFISKISPAAAERLILELPELSEYSGQHDAIINLSNVAQSGDEIRDFVEKNKVWAIMMTKEDSEGRFAGLMGLDTGIYIMGEVDGFITKAD